jgi:hypothetical protein
MFIFLGFRRIRKNSDAAGTDLGEDEQAAGTPEIKPWNPTQV